MRTTRQLATLTLVLLSQAALVSSCASRRTYDSLSTGQFDGSLNLHWVSPDRFVYVPDPENPFKFTRSNGEVIQPGPMFTDGGSIPRLLRVHPDFSPMGYAPAFVIHDWLFAENSRAAALGQPYDVKASALVLAEGIKTLMEADNSIRRKPLSLYILYRSMETSVSDYAVHIKPWHSDLPPPEEVLAMGSRFFDNIDPDTPAPAAKIIKEKINLKLLTRSFLLPFAPVKQRRRAGPPGR